MTLLGEVFTGIVLGAFVPMFGSTFDYKKGTRRPIVLPLIMTAAVVGIGIAWWLQGRQGWTPAGIAVGVTFGVAYTIKGWRETRHLPKAESVQCPRCRGKGTIDGTETS